MRDEPRAVGLKADEWANGHIVSRPDGVVNPLIRLTCKTGTGDIRPPRTTCASEGTPWVSTWEDKAEAYIYRGANTITAVGATDWNG
ncbi:hypothetical protein E1263_00490 [Kribbella antibiotica]|uniref:Uncharacterized protein n=1 Tax=Kribbella antibiotica TaxID=190195 RepID=A0A4R4ZYM2_9ACTN|nr:hypothetical protein [Kribbella antibiotica]TDD63464.1 hypothetical protein E1263_00490 [Kribbella antibiotica]